MIRYSLTCDQGHSFESWFADAAAFATLQASGQLNCAICGSAKVEKALMAPSVRSGRKADARNEAALAQKKATALPARPDLKAPMSEMEQAIAALRAEVEANSEYVGDDFAKEARAMHEGEAPERAIYGEAKLEETRQLIDDGIAVLPLPFMPARKAN